MMARQLVSPPRRETSPSPSSVAASSTSTKVMPERLFILDRLSGAGHVKLDIQPLRFIVQHTQTKRATDAVGAEKQSHVGGTVRIGVSLRRRCRLVIVP